MTDIISMGLRLVGFVTAGLDLESRRPRRFRPVTSASRVATNAAVFSNRLARTGDLAPLSWK